MSIHKTKKGTYRVRWRECGRMKSKNFVRKIEAEKFEAKLKLKDQLPQGLTPVTPLPSSLSFKDLSTLWLKDYAEVHKVESSIIRDRQIIRDYLLPVWGETPVNAISKRDVAMLQGKLRSEKRLSPKTINHVVGLAHKIFCEAVRWDFMTSNPVYGTKAIKIPVHDYQFWTFEERDRFLSYAKAEIPTLYPIIAVAVHTGLRRGEMEGLLRDAVDLERKEIIVRRSFCHKTNRLNEYTKGKRPRRVPMNDLVFNILRERSLTPMKEPVLPYDYEHILWRDFYPAQEKAQVTPIRFHDLRHTFASHLAMMGTGVFQIKELLGHSDLSTTQRYMHLAPGHLLGITDVLMAGRGAMDTRPVLVSSGSLRAIAK